MSAFMNKDEALKDFILKYVKQEFQEQTFLINERYKGKKENIKNSLISAFESVCEKGIKLQENGKKEGIQFFYISLLRTSIMENKSFYRIDIYDNKWFLDKEECFAIWNADFIFDSLFKHMDLLEEKKKEYGRKITSMDIDKIKFSEALKYHILTIGFLREMIPNILKCKSYKSLKKADEMYIIAGEYMDQGEVIHEEKMVKK